MQWLLTVSEIDLDDPDLEFEIELYVSFSNDIGVEYILAEIPTDYDHNGTASVIPFALYKADADLRINLGGNFKTIFPDAFVLGASTVSVSYKNGIFTTSTDAGTHTETITIGSVRGADSSLYIAATAYVEDGVETAKSFLGGGVLRDIKIWTGGDRNTGTLTREYRMDEGWRGYSNQVLSNYATTLGGELFDPDKMIVTPPATYDPDSKTFTAYRDGDTGTGWCMYQSGLVNGVTYLIKHVGDVPYRPTGLNMRDGSGKISLNVQDFETTSVFTLENSFIRYTRSLSTEPYEAPFRVNTLRQADGYGTYIGLTGASWTEEEV